MKPDMQGQHPPIPFIHILFAEFKNIAAQVDWMCKYLLMFAKTPNNGCPHRTGLDFNND